jgi:hypothetical protein
MGARTLEERTGKEEMNRRGFIRSALAAAFGVAAGAIIPTTPVEVFKKVEDFSAITFKEIKWIEDTDCPADVIYLLNSNDMKKIGVIKL